MIGVKIEKSISDWQILQQEDGYAKVELSGTYIRRDDIGEGEQIAKTPKIYAMVSKEESGEPVIWWKECSVLKDRWSITLNIPAGGPYTIHTSMTEKENEDWSEWGTRGDIIGHVGVGDLYVIAGQSNSAGIGKDFIYDPPELGVNIYKNNKKWSLATHPLQDSTGAFNNPNCETGVTGHSLYLSFAKYLKRDLGYPIGLIQTSQGGSRLSSWNPQEEGSLYRNMIERIKECGGKVKAIIWYQGCSETDEMDLAKSYVKRFSKMREGIIKELGAESIPFVVFQVAYSNFGEKDDELDKKWGTVREELRRLGHEFGDIYVIPTTDSTYSDFIHISASANVRLGERAAKAVLHHLFEKNYMCDAPDISKARWVDDETVEVSFDNVYEHLEARVEGKKLAIKAQDSEGIINVLEYEIKEHNKMLLKFERKPGKESVLHCGYTKIMEDFIPFDFATHLPILSFYKIKIED